MHRIDGAGHLDHRFVTEDAATGRPPTEVTDTILNAFQEEICTVIEGAGIALDKANNAQLLASIRGISAAAILALLGQANSWGGAQSGSIITLTDAATIDVDLSAGNNFVLMIAGSRVLGTPAGVVPGQSGVITIKQDVVGGRALAFSSGWVFSMGRVFSLTPTPHAVDNLYYYVDPFSRVWLSIGPDGR